MFLIDCILGSQNSIISSLSLASLNFKKSENIQEEDKIELPNDDFTENDVKIAWKKFCDNEKVNGNNNMLSLLNMNDPVIENNSINPEVISLLILPSLEKLIKIKETTNDNKINRYLYFFIFCKMHPPINRVLGHYTKSLYFLIIQEQGK